MPASLARPSIAGVERARGAPWPGRARLAVAALAGLAALAGMLLGTGHTAAARSGGDPALVMLLRLMAGLKLAMAVGASWLVDWRLRMPVSPRLGALYGGAVALMALAPGLIWGQVDILAGAGAFHAGLILFLVCAGLDRGGAGQAFAAALRRRPNLYRAQRR